ncbi:MAG: RagB/SusD family nutrient uptake outer membrane protein [Prolixibacteraceae bacterium]|nr:RagB/SusD family nutrient uptake outer membrane protein [Prolixibacteraceae bacterium]NLS99645.1 RagB/SusD family nutrient uptake outer membrane protein [Bacteroidales bacterium]OQB81698.1 MAG: SusD family protein [Bacteroidetes bacterium ADurb.Bin123]HNU77608.1 RagB/SusD family nutrient uptake outer membrane protein [Prolixibacteraceae bacterium]HPY26445.1 RagB/SusD family nutrient uptake outer membrane protein [Prolixibacteraceae bacterium]
MKSILKILVTIFLAGTIAACDYLDVVPDNVAVIENAFSDKYNAEKFLATCYSYIPNFGDPWINPGLLSGDEVWFNEEIMDDSNTAAMIAKGEQNSLDPFLNFWDGGQRGKNMYVGIRDCNIFLEEIKRVGDMSEIEKKKWIAEVKFMKAYYHFWLFKSYGPIPIVDENLPIYVSTEEVKIYRDPVDSVVNYIVKLIDEAIPDLPLMLLSEVTDLGRITKPIATAIKARVLATAASPLFNGNPDFASLTDNRGVKLFPATFDATKWQKAADAALEAIETAEMANFRLVDSYQTKYKHSEAMMRELMLRSIVTTKGNTEVIWGCTNFPFSHTYQRMLQPLLITVTDANPVSQFYAATLRMAELYYSKNGVPIEEDVSFPYEDRYTLRTAVTAESDYVRSGETTAMLHFDRESRFYASIAFDRGTFVLEPTYYYVQCRAGEMATKRNKGEFSVTGYWPKKLLSPRNGFSGNSYEIDYNFPFPIIRLADIYLLYAEALNEVKAAPDAEVYEYIDKVRERAGLLGVVESWAAHSKNPQKPATKEGMRKIIQQERMIELSFEGQRFWDLRRWKLALDYMNRPIRGWDISGRNLNFYNVTTVYTPRFEFKDYFWPIRERERINNPNLVQNLGW